MAHYVTLDIYNRVTDIFVGKDENEGDLDWEQHYSEITGKVVKRTSYNTRANVHVTGGIPYRKNYAARGYTYDYIRDAFIPPKPYPSWVLDEDTCHWIPPVPIPEDITKYVWNEATTSFVLIENA